MIFRKQKPVIPTTEGIRGVPLANVVDLRPKVVNGKRRVKILGFSIGLVTLLIIIAVVIIMIITLKQPQKAPTINYRTFNSRGVSFQYPDKYAAQSIADSAKVNTLAILSETSPESVITVHFEKDADKSAQAAKRNILDDLEASASRSLPLTHTGFQKLTDDRVQVSGVSSTDIAFSYTGKDKHTTVYAHLLIVPRGHDAYYVTIESTSKSLADSDMAKIRQTLKLP